jgi:hypothetical protein
MVSSMVFHVLPTALEISMVCGILVRERERERERERNNRKKMLESKFPF